MLRLIALFLTLFCVCQAHFQRFSTIANDSSYPRGVANSPCYRVLVKPANDLVPWNTDSHATATYKLWPDYLDPETLPEKHANTAVHVAQVDADVRVRVRVELLTKTPIQTLRLKPSRLKELEVTKVWGPHFVEFEVNPSQFTRSVLIEINPPVHDADALQDGLLFFLNPPSVLPAGNVLQLPSGIVDSDTPYMDELNRILVTPDSPYDAIYIPQNTLVDGRIDVRKPGFKVMGRGMIIGSRWPFVKAVPGWRQRYPEWISPNGEWVRPLLSYIHPKDAPDDETSTFEGVLVAHPYHFCVGWAYQNDNLKTFGWRFSSDGIHGVHKRGSFMRVNDDATYINEGSVEDCTYWGMVNGACLQLGWGLTRDNNTPVHVRRIDVVRGEWDNAVNPGVDGLGAPDNVELPTKKNASSNRGVFVGTFRSGQAFTIRHKFFEDVRVDAQVNRLFYFGSRTEEVSYENFVFKNIWFEQRPNYLEDVQNVLEGKVTVGGFIFENFTIGDHRVESLDDFAPLKQRNLHDVIFR